MASSTGQAAPSPAPASPVVANAAPPPATNMEPKMDAGLLALACSGSFEDLESLLNGKQATYTIGSSATQPPALYAVTVGGGTLLHVVAAVYGDSEDSTKKARLVYDKAPSLLFVQNSQGDTPLHCAARAGNFRMVSLLVDLANGQGVNNAKDLLETQNKIHETALHQAVRSGDNDMVKLLMTQDPELATLPEEGTSPLYLAILLQKKKHRENTLRVEVEGRGYFIFWTKWTKCITCCCSPRQRGRTFLHIAVEKGKMWTVRSACRNRSISWILNMQDNDGDTALHLAIKKGSLRTFCYLFENTVVHLNLTNQRGDTPLDIACHNLPKGSFYTQNSEVKIHRTLNFVGAKRGISQQDYCKENDIVQERQDEIHKIDQVKEGTQSLCIGSVLIATVTFGATFAMPGGYRADDHTNGGTPTLAGRYAFDAFTLANALAFTLSAMATISLLSSGSPLLHPRSRRVHLLIAYYLLPISLTSLVAAFALGTYMLLAPVAHKTAIGVCVLSSLVLLYQNLEWAVKHIAVLPGLCMRNGIVWTFTMSATSIMGNILAQHWPIIIIFCSTIRNYHVQKVKPSAQSPAPLH